MLKELEFEDNYETDFQILIKVALEIGNSLAGEKASTNNPNIHFAEGIGQKIISHAISAHYLSNGYKIATDKHLYVEQIDFSSVSILVRAAFESYLTFNYVFVSSKDENELAFRFKCWNLGGFIDRADNIPTQDQHIELKAYEKSQIDIIRFELQQSGIFKNL